MPYVGFEPMIPASERAKTVPLGYRDYFCFVRYLLCACGSGVGVLMLSCYALLVAQASIDKEEQ
jgi:hypothetical protein